MLTYFNLGNLRMDLGNSFNLLKLRSKYVKLAKYSVAIGKSDSKLFCNIKLVRWSEFIKESDEMWSISFHEIFKYSKLVNVPSTFGISVNLF